jgi:hypothetical protein
MQKRITFFLILLLCALVNGGGCNAFNDPSSKNSDAAILDDISNLINHSKWNDAILKFSLLSPLAFQLQSTIVLEASAYAGRGGLSLVSLLEALNANTTSGAKTFFQELMVAFPKASRLNYNDEKTAESLILGLRGSPVTGNSLAQLTVDQSVFLIFIEFAKFGTLFSSIGDPNGNLSLDPSFDNCDKTQLSDADATQVATGFGILLTLIANVANTFAKSGFGNLAAMCANLPPGTCGILDVNDPLLISQPFILRAMRTLVGETNSGIGLAVVANASTFEFAAPMNAFPANLCP